MRAAPVIGLAEGGRYAEEAGERQISLRVGQADDEATQLSQGFVTAEADHAERLHQYPGTLDFEGVGWLYAADQWRHYCLQTHCFSHWSIAQAMSALRMAHLRHSAIGI